MPQGSAATVVYLIPPVWVVDSHATSAVVGDSKACYYPPNLDARMVCRCWAGQSFDRWPILDFLQRRTVGVEGEAFESHEDIDISRCGRIRAKTDGQSSVVQRYLRLASVRSESMGLHVRLAGAQIPVVAQFSAAHSARHP